MTMNPTNSDRPTRTLPRFPTLLRKMWSGSEVQEWIDNHIQPVLEGNGRESTSSAHAVARMEAVFAAWNWSEWGPRQAMRDALQSIPGDVLDHALKVAIEAKAAALPTRVADGVVDTHTDHWFAECRRALEDVATEMRATGRSDTRFVRLLQSMPHNLAVTAPDGTGPLCENFANVEAVERYMHDLALAVHDLTGDEGEDDPLAVLQRYNAARRQTAPDSTQPLLSAQGSGVSNAADSTGRGSGEQALRDVMEMHPDADADTVMANASTRIRRLYKERDIALAAKGNHAVACEARKGGACNCAELNERGKATLRQWLRDGTLRGAWANEQEEEVAAIGAPAASSADAVDLLSRVIEKLERDGDEWKVCDDLRKVGAALSAGKKVSERS